MANFNNPNNPLGMMQQHQGFMNSPSSGQMSQQHNSPGPGFANMNQVPTGSGMQGYQGTGMGTGFNQLSHPSPNSMQQQHHPNPITLMPSGPIPRAGIRNQSPSDNMNPNMLSSPGQNFQQQHHHQQQQQKDLNTGPPRQNPMQQQQQQQQQQKELNAASLCRFGQETVQEVVSRTQELFSLLKAAQPPDGKQMGIDRKHKFQETLKGLRILFKRLRVIYEKMEESFPSSDDTYFEDSIPLMNGNEVTILDDKKDTEAYKLAVEEYRDVQSQVVFRNRHLKETVDFLRQIIWDINTMLAMRKE